MEAKVAVYAGTFDPLTYGHLDILQRAARTFGKVIIAVANNSQKDMLFPLEKRVDLIEASLKASASFNKDDNIEVRSFDTLLVSFCSKVGAEVIVRGLRAVSDYEYESQMAILNRQLEENIETVFFMTSKNWSYVSSSIVKEVAKYGGDLSSLVPKQVEKALKQAYC